MIKLTQKLEDRVEEPVTTLTLPWEQRTKSRLRVVLDNGKDAGLFLSRGSILRGNDLVASEDGYVVQVRAAHEPLSMVTCNDPLAMARACYHLGNRHTSLEITANHFQYLTDPVLDRMVIGLGLEVYFEKAPFEPEVGAYTGGGHHHG
jgi:urease accessory protein